MLAFYWLYGAALVAFGYAVSTLFSTSRVAGTASQLIYAVSMVPGFLLPFTQPLGGAAWFLACLSPTSAASLFAAALVNWERAALGGALCISWATLWLPITQDSSFSAGHVLLLLAADVPLYAALTWYLDKVVRLVLVLPLLLGQMAAVLVVAIHVPLLLAVLRWQPVVMPRTYGQRLPPWFPLVPSYWISRGDSSRDSITTTPAGAATLTASDILRETSAAVSVRGLTKVFPAAPGGGAAVRALDGLSFDVRRGTVTALLGHNGAGKTTAIHILTGMLQPSGGSAAVEGLDVATSMAAIRRSLGVCPQFDILWPRLTVAEHLTTYWALKGGGGDGGGAAGARAAVAAAAAEVGLSEKLDTPAGQLSGGQRRKLSVAIAFLRYPKARTAATAAAARGAASQTHKPCPSRPGLLVLLPA
ncbi:ATP-binding cassette sub-family A member 7 [Monoraphidium neglectum]|uniref:ATP-binding cassette sub-family A member 7 n=1 Tax=Monoraphidium neglectum TaxID=145388 RepID=A0A0D2MFS4_9CHLO|nr:ATP-binding cassette sub-family A member 7 [Monoraphidium neglectum]KIY93955.1 ATP-binding cassette sub-family A member 7 [Monoraphidium neglectum]|eukprot:XP_013892975.1 ATP-binding cassette sub-family A member 7 [Monoraphidium neglectum]